MPTPTSTPVIDMNLLPEGTRPVQFSPAAALIVIGIAVILAISAPLALRLADARARADAAGQQARDAERGLHGVQVDLAEHRALLAQLEDTQQRFESLRDERRRLQGGVRPLAEDLATVLRADLQPPGGTLATVSGEGSGLKVEGTAGDPLDAIAFADRLVRSGGFASATLLSFAPGGSSGKFVIQVTR